MFCTIFTVYALNNLDFFFSIISTECTIEKLTIFNNIFNTTVQKSGVRFLKEINTSIQRAKMH